MLTNTSKMKPSFRLGAVTCRQGIARQNVRSSDKPSRAWNVFPGKSANGGVSTLGNTPREIKTGEYPALYIPSPFLIQRNDARTNCPHLGPFELSKRAVS